MVRKYSTPFLKEVIVRLDFASPVTRLAKALPQKLTKVISPLFPIGEPKQFIGKELMVSKDATKERVLQGTDWYFHSIDKQKTLIVAQDNVNISYKTYASFDIVNQDFLPIVEALFSSYDDFQGRRIGLRYRNEISLSEANVLDWTDYLDRRLLAFFDFPEDPKRICRAFNNLELNYGDFIARFQYGMLNPDYPAPVRRKSFTLDYDAYRQGPQDFEDVKQNMNKFHDAIQKLFEQSITDRLRSLMGVEGDGQER